MEIILFIDHVGFTIVGEKVNDAGGTLQVKNPAVLQAAPNQQNQLQVQLVPVLFKEFLDSSKREEGVVFTYQKDKIVLSSADLDSRLKTQYTQMFSNTPSIQTAPQQNSGEVIKLFDDEDDNK
jgi:hypothetical protein